LVEDQVLGPVSVLGKACVWVLVLAPLDICVAFFDDLKVLNHQNVIIVVDTWNTLDAHYAM
jgi:hypothetical protein